MLRFCKHCRRKTNSSTKKILTKGRRTIGFFICLTCGNPYEYKSFKALFQSIYGNRKSAPRSKKSIKYGKAGTSKDTYKLYLQTDHWKNIRKLKLKTTPICEFCNKNKAIQVHHLTYTDSYGATILYRERLEDLASICLACHKKTHSI